MCASFDIPQQMLNGLVEGLGLLRLGSCNTQPAQPIPGSLAACLYKAGFLLVTGLQARQLDDTGDCSFRPLRELTGKFGQEDRSQALLSG